MIKNKIKVRSEWFSVLIGCFVTNKGLDDRVKSLKCETHGQGFGYKMGIRNNDDGTSTQNIVFDTCCPEFVETVLRRAEEVAELRKQEKIISIDREQ